MPARVKERALTHLLQTKVIQYPMIFFMSPLQGSIYFYIYTRRLRTGLFIYRPFSGLIRIGGETCLAVGQPFEAVILVRSNAVTRIIISL